MAPRKAITTSLMKKRKGKENMAPTIDVQEDWYSEIQYPDGVLLGKEWLSHVTNMVVSDAIPTSKSLP